MSDKQNMIKGNRLQYIDFGAGMMILWMIIYHALLCAWQIDITTLTHDALPISNMTHAYLDQSGNIAVQNPCVLFPFLSFFMPYFFYKSGTFHHHKPWANLLRKDARKLLGNYFLWGAIGYSILIFICTFDGSSTIRELTYSTVVNIVFRGRMPINSPLWFLLTLFGVRIIANILLPSDSPSPNRNWIFHTQCLLVIISGYVLSYFVNRHLTSHTPYWIANGASGLCFYSFGFWLRTFENKWWLIVPSIVVYFICSIIGFPIVDMFSNKLLSGHYLLWIPIDVFCIVAFNTACKFMTYMSSSVSRIRVSLPLELVGKCSMPIYVTHYLFLQLYTLGAATHTHTHTHTPILICLMIILVLVIVFAHNHSKKH